MVNDSVGTTLQCRYFGITINAARACSGRKHHDLHNGVKNLGRAPTSCF